MAGSLQISGLNPTTVIFADEGGADIQVVANESIQTKDETNGGLLARNGSNLHAPRDLVGKKIAIPGLNSVAHVAFMKWLQTKGIDPTSVNDIEMPMPRIGDAMQADQVDAPSWSSLCRTDRGAQAWLHDGRLECHARRSGDDPCGLGDAQGLYRCPSGRRGGVPGLAARSDRLGRGTSRRGEPTSPICICPGLRRRRRSGRNSVPT